MNLILMTPILLDLLRNKVSGSSLLQYVLSLRSRLYKHKILNTAAHQTFPIHQAMNI